MIWSGAFDCFGVPRSQMIAVYDAIVARVASDSKSKSSGQMSLFDNLLKDAMMGSENVDVHDVMIAMSKAEIAINVATTATGKIIQAYDKIMQIQI